MKNFEEFLNFLDESTINGLEKLSQFFISNKKMKEKIVGTKTRLRSKVIS